MPKRRVPQRAEIIDQVNFPPVAVFIEKLTHEDIIHISNAMMNEYVPHEEPARSSILKLHRIAESLRK